MVVETINRDDMKRQWTALVKQFYEAMDKSKPGAFVGAMASINILQAAIAGIKGVDFANTWGQKLIAEVEGFFIIKLEPGGQA